MQQNTQRTSWRNLRGNDELNVLQTSLTCLCKLADMKGSDLGGLSKSLGYRILLIGWVTQSGV